MHFIIEDPTLIFLLLGFLGLFILTQLYLIYKIKLIVERILDIFIRTDRLIKRINHPSSPDIQDQGKCCQNCNYRRIFFHSDSEPYFYIKCFLNNQPVDPEFCCPNYVMDTQSYEI